MKDEGRIPTALAAYRVVDLSDSVGGQFCARLFADMGAAVTLVEPPAGSATRRIGPFDGKGRSLQFFHLNFNKRILALPATGDKMDELLRTADVVVASGNFDAQRASALNPDVVPVEVTPFGTDGPLRHWKAPEIVLQALSGMMNNNGTPGREPLYGVGQRASYAAGVAAYAGAVAALFARNAGAGAQRVAVDAAETAAAMCFPYVLQYIYNGTDRRRGDQDLPAGQVMCRDGWVCIWVYSHRFAAACATLGLDALIHDPRFADPSQRSSNWDAFFALVQEKVADREAQDVVASLQEAQVIAAKANRPSELAAHPHLATRGYWEIVTRGGEPRRVLGPPFRMSRTPRLSEAAR